MVNTQYLNDLIKASGKKKKYLAACCNLTQPCMRRKELNKSVFTVNEVAALCKELGITDLNVKEAVFFAKDVEQKVDK